MPQHFSARRLLLGVAISIKTISAVWIGAVSAATPELDNSACAPIQYVFPSSHGQTLAKVPETMGDWTVQEFYGSTRDDIVVSAAAIRGTSRAGIMNQIMEKMIARHDSGDRTQPVPLEINIQSHFSQDDTCEFITASL